MSIPVSVDNFARAETARMFHDIQADAGGINSFRHNREPARIDQQTVIRLNRDTLYSFAIVDLSAGAVLTLPDPAGRYLSAMVVNEDHFVSHILHQPGDHDLSVDSVGSAYALVAVRALVDASDPDDVAAVGRLQDEMRLSAGSQRAYAPGDYDTESLDETRDALLQLARRLTGYDRMFGARDEVDPVRHLIGTAAGWGGLPTTEAAYAGLEPGLPPGRYEMRFVDVPVDAFWSVSVYNARGFFEPNESGRYTVNSVMGRPDPDGAITVRFVPGDDVDRDVPNTIPVPEGWNILVRLYRPRAAIRDGEWSLPPLVQQGS